MSHVLFYVANFLNLKSGKDEFVKGGIIMNKEVINWLLEDSNPAIKYRTQTEILGQTVDVTPAKEWVYSKLPEEWYKTKGLWYIYYVTALAQCGLSKDDISSEQIGRAHV